MGWSIDRSQRPSLWALAERQHGVVARQQLLALGFSASAIEHRVSRGRLHPVWRGVYAIGRPQLTMHGRWMGAVLACGPKAAVSHESAAALWGIRSPAQDEIHVCVPGYARRRRPGIVVHRRTGLSVSVTRRHAVPVTTPVHTLVDLAARVDRNQLEAAISEADKRALTDPEQLRGALDELPPRPGLAALREMLDRRTFTLTDSDLERRFLPLARRAGLPLPQTGHHLNGFKVDFYWPELGLVVETDGLRDYRTPAQQTRDRVRDHAHAAAGLTPLRFTRAQVVFEPDHVRSTLAAVARRLEPSSGPLG